MLATRPDNAHTHGREVTQPLIKVAVLDDQPLFVDGVAMALEKSDDMNLVLRAGTNAYLMSTLGQVDADVLLMEPWAPSGDGLDGLAWASREFPGMAIIAVSYWSDDSHVRQVVAQGAHAYVSKATRATDLPSIIRHVATGATMLPAPTEHHPGADLTPREVDVLALAARGMSNAEVGRQLFVTEQTVKFHLGNVYRKLGAGNRTEAAHVATRRGLIR